MAVTRSARTLVLLASAWMLCATARAGSEPPQVTRRGEWNVAETKHFAVWTALDGTATAQTATVCEELRSRLSAVWLGDSPSPEWTSPCVVVVHRDVAAYGTAIGAPGNVSVGCTTFQLNRGAIRFRRVDVRADAASWQTSALAHELTHVVIADRFAGRSLPLWADEGIAVLSEPEATHRRRVEALATALRSGAAEPLPKLLARTDDPPATLRDGFYGQSALLAATLIERGTPARFLDFLGSAEHKGYDTALREVYGLAGLPGLESVWAQKRNAARLGAFDEAIGQAALTIRVRGGALPVSLSERRTP